MKALVLPLIGLGVLLALAGLIDWLDARRKRQRVRNDQQVPPEPYHTGE